jgi:hypothetical protein
VQIHTIPETVPTLLLLRPYILQGATLHRGPAWENRDVQFRWRVTEYFRNISHTAETTYRLLHVVFGVVNSGDDELLLVVRYHHRLLKHRDLRLLKPTLRRKKKKGSWTCGNGGKKKVV